MPPRIANLPLVRLTMTLLCVTGLSFRVLAQAPSEYEVKAAMVYNLTKYVTWPSPWPFQNASICVLGRDPFGATLDKAVAGRSIGNMPILIRRLSDSQELNSCAVLFISASEQPRIREILRRVETTPVLTVGDMKNFAASGGGVGLVQERNRIGLEVNLGATNKAGVRVSARLLKLAKVY